MVITFFLVNEFPYDLTRLFSFAVKSD